MLNKGHSAVGIVNESTRAVSVDDFHKVYYMFVIELSHVFNISHSALDYLYILPRNSKVKEFELNLFL